MSIVVYLVIGIVLLILLVTNCTLGWKCDKDSEYENWDENWKFNKYFYAICRISMVVSLLCYLLVLPFIFFESLMVVAVVFYILGSIVTIFENLLELYKYLEFYRNKRKNRVVKVENSTVTYSKNENKIVETVETTDEETGKVTYEVR